jgi:ferredoxin
MLTKEIAEVEKGCGRALSLDLDKGIFSCGKKGYCELCKAKLSTLKSAQQKFDKFVEEEVKWLEERKEKELECYHDCGTSINLHYINKRIKELSSKQEKIE